MKNKPVKDQTWHRLKEATRTTLVPFELTLAGSPDVLYCDSFFRILPGKRLVALAQWGGGTVIAKLFYDARKAARHAERDATGLKKLSAAGVLSPAVYFQGRASDKRIHVLLLEYLDGKSVDQLWQEKKSLQDISKLMHAIIIELATLHVLGVLQKDLHFKNFIVKKKKIHMLDGGDVAFFPRPLTKKESLDNLGLFFAQLGVAAAVLQKPLFQTYVRSRGWIVKKRDMALLASRVNYWQQQRLSDFKNKLTRNCSAFVKQETRASVAMYDREAESVALLHCLKHPDTIFALPETTIVKEGRSATVAQFTLDGQAMVMKRYNMKSTAHWLRRCLRPSRAAHSWKLSQTLRLLGVATPRCTAFVEKRRFGLRGGSWLVMECIQGKHIGEYFKNTVADSVATLAMAKKVVILFEELARLRITHGDLKMSNILVEQEKPFLIDLDGMQEHDNSYGFKRVLKRDMQRFMLNWQDMPTVASVFSQLIKGMYEKLGV